MGGFGMVRVLRNHRPSLELWFYLLYARDSGENPWQIFHARTSYGAWHGALRMGDRTAFPNWRFAQGTSTWGYGVERDIHSHW